MTNGESMTGYSDAERIALAATWTDDAYQRLGAELNRACGGTTPDMVTMDLDTMEALHDGLWVLAGTLHALLGHVRNALEQRQTQLEAR